MINNFFISDNVFMIQIDLYVLMMNYQYVD